MYTFIPVEEQLAPRSTDPAHKQTSLWSCMYVTVFTVLYALSFAMPFWTTDIPMTASGSAHTDSSHVTPVDQPAEDVSSQGNGSQLQQRSFSEVWRYSWEYTGLAVRCTTLLLLLLGCVVSGCRLCSDRGLHHPFPASMPILCGIVSGVTGVYAELVLWLGVCLLAPNKDLTESLVFCSVTSLFSFFVGIAVYRSRVSTHDRAASPSHNSPDPFMRDLDRLPHGGGGACVHHFPPSDDDGFRDSPQGRRSVATATEEVPAYSSAADPRNLYDSNDHLFGLSEEDEVCKTREGEFASHVCADVCPPDDLPDGLHRPTEVGLRDRDDDLLPDPSPARSEEDIPTKDLPADDLLRQRDACEGGGDRIRNVDNFDHRDQFIDDDFYYHSSDDQLLERFIEVGSSLHERHGSQACSMDSKASANTTARLIQTERTQQLLPFPDSEEYHSFSDDEISYKNKTWP